MHAVRASLTGLLSGSSATLVLAAVPSSVRSCRNFCRRVMVDWGLEQLSHDASIVVSELVTNAVLHAGTDFQLRLARLPEGVLIEVADGSRDLGGLGDVGDLGEEAHIATLLSERTTGRGLQMVNVLAEAWGVMPAPTGKTVWAVVGGSVPVREPAPQWRPVTPVDFPAAEAVRTGQVVVTRTPLERDLLFPDFDTDGIMDNLALACIPLCKQGRPVGCVAISFRRSRDFSHNDLELFSQLAEAAATVL
jgi:GAF domain-containing protein